ncbi:MAG TPA: hypothetical protein VJU61_07770 [Polyangiaceae bacterium]|nr:hypothetical protein [Polyangiaceae bacterium]
MQIWALLMSLLGLTWGGSAPPELAASPYASSSPLAPDPYLQPEPVPAVLVLAPMPYGRRHVRRISRANALPLAAMPYAGPAQAEQAHAALHPAALAPSPYELGQPELAPLPY